MVGFLSHLVLDEIYSVDFRGARIKLKSSAGSAVKFMSSSTCRHGHLLPDPRQPRLSGLPGLQEADDDRDGGEQADGNASLSHRESGPFGPHFALELTRIRLKCAQTRTIWTKMRLQTDRV